MPILFFIFMLSVQAVHSTDQSITFIEERYMTPKELEDAEFSQMRSTLKEFSKPQIIRKDYDLIGGVSLCLPPGSPSKNPDLLRIWRNYSRWLGRPSISPQIPKEQKNSKGGDNYSLQNTKENWTNTKTEGKIFSAVFDENDFKITDEYEVNELLLSEKDLRLKKDDLIGSLSQEIADNLKIWGAYERKLGFAIKVMETLLGQNDDGSAPLLLEFRAEISHIQEAEAALEDPNIFKLVEIKSGELSLFWEGNGEVDPKVINHFKCCDGGLSSKNPLERDEPTIHCFFGKFETTDYDSLLSRLNSGIRIRSPEIHQITLPEIEKIDLSEIEKRDLLEIEKRDLLKFFRQYPLLFIDTDPSSSIDPYKKNFIENVYQEEIYKREMYKKEISSLLTFETIKKFLREDKEALVNSLTNSSQALNRLWVTCIETFLFFHDLSPASIDANSSIFSKAKQIYDLRHIKSSKHPEFDQIIFNWEEYSDLEDALNQLNARTNKDPQFIPDHLAFLLGLYGESFKKIFQEKHKYTQNQMSKFKKLLRISQESEEVEKALLREKKDPSLHEEDLNGLDESFHSQNSDRDLDLREIFQYLTPTEKEAPLQKEDFDMAKSRWQKRKIQLNKLLDELIKLEDDKSVSNSPLAKNFLNEIQLNLYFGVLDLSSCAVLDINPMKNDEKVFYSDIEKEWLKDFTKELWIEREKSHRCDKDDDFIKFVDQIKNLKELESSVQEETLKNLERLLVKRIKGNQERVNICLQRISTSPVFLKDLVKLPSLAEGLSPNETKALSPEINLLCDEIKRNIDCASKDLDRLKKIPCLKQPQNKKTVWGSEVSFKENFLLRITSWLEDCKNKISEIEDLRHLS